MQESKRWTVAELNRYIRQLFETDYRLQDVEVCGEISDWRVPGSGHAYFSLKDATAQLRCVMWRSDVQAQLHLPKHGDQVIVQGYMSVYEASGQMQFYARSIIPAGEGDLHARFEALKAALAAEGLFDPETKRSIPPLPQRIGIATSRTTAALQDVLTVLERRYPLAEVILADTPVQGEQAPRQIIAALEALNNREDIDLILLVRGGGSLEDLWCFNDETLTRVVAASRIPIITGVGHEIDFTLVDFASDLRAPTPSAAAELATPVPHTELITSLREKRMILTALLAQAIDQQGQVLASRQMRLRQQSPRHRVINARQHVDEISGRMQRTMQSQMSLLQMRLRGNQRSLASLNPLATLARGYAIVEGADGILRDTEAIEPGDSLKITLHKGRASVIVESTEG